jgi:very-short-patch-repair endonuclease
MTFKQKMHPTISNAEWNLRTKLNKSGIRVIQQFEIIMDRTTVDFYFPSKRLCVFLDGPPHLKEHVEARDEFVDEKLQKRGYKILRFPYKPPLSKKMLNEIMEKIKENLE